MKLRIIATTLLAMCLISCNSQEKTLEQIKATLLQDVPGLTKIDQINKTDLGIYEVVIGRKIFYTSKDAKYLILGNIVDIKSKKSVTDDRIAELSKIDFSKLPLEIAIKSVHGDGSRSIAVFSDPDCPYCKMFEKDVAPKLLNVTVYTFIFPLPMHKDAKLHSQEIICSANPLKTWTDWMQNATPLPTNISCNTSVLDKMEVVGRDLVQIDGTPTIVLANGQIIAGMMPAEQLNSMIATVSTNAVKSDTSAPVKN